METQKRRKDALGLLEDNFLNEYPFAANFKQKTNEKQTPCFRQNVVRVITFAQFSSFSDRSITLPQYINLCVFSLSELSSILWRN